ncbi:MAG: phenylalanine--tRNA ligase subunit beta [bacterium]|nr:phenylalanine--tRNA ligase subunit beta [bacterium]
MPIVSFSVKQLNNLLAEKHPMEEIMESIRQLGCDVEDAVDINLYRCPACDALNDKLAGEEPVNRCTFCGHEAEEGFEKFASDSVIRIDLLADRPDLFDVPGLSRALKGYLEIEEGLPEFPCEASDIKVNVDPSVLEIRPYIVCAVAEIPPLDHIVLRELMKLQENLHWGVGRDRKLASIGIYDLDTLAGPIVYKSVAPTGFKFHPLTMPDVEMTPAEILKNHPKGAAYAHLLEKLPRYPLLIDSKGLTLSMPPIINSDETKCRIGTTRLFIDVTGTGEHAVSDALNILACTISDLGGKLKTVKIDYPDRSVTTPAMAPREIDVSFRGTVKWLGIDLSRDEFIHCIKKMRLDITPRENDDDGFIVKYPAFRSDIRHEVDIFEDVLIGYGVDNVKMELVPTMTVGQERPEERLANMARAVMGGIGFTEIMSLNLQSEESHFTRLGMEPDDAYVRVDNPKTVNQRVLRNHLMTGIMETFEKNKKKTVPQKIFETGPVTFLDPDAETGVAEYRDLAFAVIGPETGYAEVRAVLDSLLMELGFKGEYRVAGHPSFIEGRCAEVTGENGLWARLGEIHPQVLNNFGLSYPIAFCEMRLASPFS